MRDWFKRKPSASEKLQADIIAKQEARIKTLEASELKLMGQIREMDQAIWSMGQEMTEAGILRHLRQILPSVERRKQLESDRIATLLIPEMQKAYR